MPLLFAITLFTSAFLLFVVQPLVANMLLPLLGGAPAVWTTCMVFYQVLLLLGYLYAHLVSRIRSKISQITIQVVLLLVAFLTLPFSRTEAMESSVIEGQHPSTWLLSHLLIMVGLPFFITSTNGPLLQRWFSFLKHEDARDPYFLYSASNLGSLLALIGYPVFFEPQFDLGEQSALWRWGFALLALLIAFCAVFFAKRGTAVDTSKSESTLISHASVTWRRRGFWILLAFVPSSLMLGLTTYLTTDIASVPLLWVIPLSLYLLSFVLVFARREWIPLKLCNRTLPVAGILLIFAILCRATEPVWAVLLIHVGFFFNAIMVCHGRLAADRPAPTHLTEFYFWMSVGGALGGVFNAVAAPVLFNEILEYPLVILLACALYLPVVNEKNPPVRGGKRFVYPAIVVGVAVLLVAMSLKLELRGIIAQFIVFGVPVILCYPLSTRPVALSVTLALVVVIGHVHVRSDKRVLFVDRSFFGVSRVAMTKNGRFRQLDHGTTAHGLQFVSADRRCEPLAYFHREGPLGGIMQVFNRNHAEGSVGLIGLGTGSTLSYSRPGQRWDVFEIDPLVIEIAGNGKLFTYLSECSAVTPRIIEGDARLQLQRIPSDEYDLLILDAFSSDSIPTHLLTVEAMELYFDKVGPNGWLAMHISNRYLNLEQVIAGAAGKMGLSGLIWFDTDVDPYNGKEESHWVVLAREEGDLRELLIDPNRIPLESRPSREPWTDNQSSILPIFKW